MFPKGLSQNAHEKPQSVAKVWAFRCCVDTIGPVVFPTWRLEDLGLSIYIYIDKSTYFWDLVRVTYYEDTGCASLGRIVW